MTRDHIEQLSLQIERATRQLRERLGGITNGEYLWEPVAGCWSVRPQEAPTWQVISNVATEVIHHGAEIGVLRDLYSRPDQLG